MLASVVATDGGGDGPAWVGHCQAVRVTVTHGDRLITEDYSVTD